MMRAIPRLARAHPIAGALSGIAFLALIALPGFRVFAAVEDAPVDAEPRAPAIVAVEHQRVTYESGEVVPYSQSSVEGRLDVTSEIVRTGDHAGTVLLLPDDPAYRGELGYRSEWQSDFYAEAGKEYAYGVSYYFPEDWDQGTNRRTFDDRIIFQFHEGNGKSPAFSLHIDAEDGMLRLRQRRPNGDFAFHWSTPLEAGKWYDIAFRTKWSRDDDGYMQVYLNGRLAYEYLGRTLTDSSRVYTKWGIYGQPTRLIVDDVRIVEGADGLTLATPARVATLLNAIPDEGFGLARFSGGVTEDLVMSSGCPSTARFWATVDGRLLAYVTNAPAFVNQQWADHFGGGIAESSVLLASCSR